MLDTNILIYAAAGFDEDLIDRLESFAHGELVLSAVSMAELERGWAGGHSDRAEATRFLKFIPILPFGEEAAAGYAAIMSDKARAPKGAFDRLIAGHALSLGIPLVTSNQKDFRRLEKVQVEDWSSSA
ncbi:type II toxin-antitoxin system VapC family toxin [Parvularcula maris]|uniref:Ribonuclease VapC n=1 Tax=Parvularcula maris TaxID=2965077 RepID=A0A9X2RJ65_9PROT|nr:type II toxin-antitoxin system VapC family toxin [Parvularcula maris]MCQ8185611.1 type II toxin-antitoxin system VapC family toxin [Parvularcula maris]